MPIALQRARHLLLAKRAKGAHLHLNMRSALAAQQVASSLRVQLIRRGAVDGRDHIAPLDARTLRWPAVHRSHNHQPLAVVLARKQHAHATELAL